MKKRIIALCMAALVAFSFVACGVQNEKGSENSKPAADQGPYRDDYKDLPLPPNAEPNWIDTVPGEDTAEPSEKKPEQDETPSDDWVVEEDKGPRWDGYKDAPLPPNAEPNWIDTVPGEDTTEPPEEKPGREDETSSDDWIVEVDVGPYWDGYRDVPLPPNAEPNWIDTIPGEDDAEPSEKQPRQEDEMPFDDWVVEE